VSGTAGSMPRTDAHVLGVRAPVLRWTLTSTGEGRSCPIRLIELL
jgi:hypothetical protein